MARLAASIAVLLAAPAAAVRLQLQQQQQQQRAWLTADTTVPAHRPLCDADLVRESCALMSSTGNATQVLPAEVQQMLSATADSAAALWEALGLSGPAQCSELCQRAVGFVGRSLKLPPSSDIGCFRAGPKTICDIDLDPTKVMGDTRFNGDLPDFHDKEVRTVARRRGVEHGPDDDQDSEANFTGYADIPYSVEGLALRVLNLFRIFPAPNVTVDEVDGNGSALFEAGVVSANQQLFQEANAEARRYVDTAIRLLNAQQRNDIVSKWFGNAAPTSSTTRREIQRVLNSINGVIGNVQFVYPGPKCSSNTYAYVYPRSSTGCSPSQAAVSPCTKNSQDQYVFYLCGLTLRVARSEVIETMTHEASHHTTAYTDDVTYGRSSCQSLASRQPARALRNADNFCYYIQDKTDLR